MRFGRALPRSISMTAGQFIAAGLAVMATTVAQTWFVLTIAAAVVS
jgi:hypothetical protein